MEPKSRTELFAEADAGELPWEQEECCLMGNHMSKNTLECGELIRSSVAMLSQFGPVSRSESPVAGSLLQKQ